MYEICGEKTNFSLLILHIFPINLNPGGCIKQELKFIMFTLGSSLFSDV